MNGPEGWPSELVREAKQHAWERPSGDASWSETRNRADAMIHAAGKQLEERGGQADLVR